MRREGACRRLAGQWRREIGNSDRLHGEGLEAHIRIAEEKDFDPEL
ncbi:hypothetical protein LJC45_02305 [Alistipes sp. OttesenSCG-928-B03]|nr:hypothetical protein [Alistipes sp. OttesenSCG-928-B03]